MNRYLLLIGLFVSLSSWAQDTLKIATEGAYPPFNYIDDSGKLGGFDVEISNALCKEMKVKCEIVQQDWDGMIGGLLARKYDAVVAVMDITAERQKKIDFTAKYLQIPARFLGKKGTEFRLDESFLNSKTIGVQKGTTMVQYILDNYPRASVKLYDTMSKAYVDLEVGRLDFVFADSAAILDGFLKTPKGEGYAFVGPEITDVKWFGEGAGIALRKGRPELKKSLNEALATILKNGTYREIADRYFDFNVYGSAY